MAKRRASDVGPKSDRKITVIANTAAKLFSSKGYVETSMEEIAAGAKVSKGSIYYYFNTKCQILDHILSTFMDTVLENARRDLREIDDPEERIRSMILQHVRTYTGNMYLAKTLMHEAHNLPAIKHRKIKVKEREYFRIVFRALSSYLKGNTDRDRLTVLTFNLLGMCNWLYSWYDPKKSINPEQLALLIFNTFMNGLSGFAHDAKKAGGSRRRQGRQG